MADKRLLVVLAVLLVALHMTPGLQAEEPSTVTLSLPDTCGTPGDTLDLPVYTTEVGDSLVLGYQVNVAYDSNFVEVLDVGLGGTLSEVWNFRAWNVVEGQDTVRIAAAGIKPLEGAGVLLTIKMALLDSAPKDSTTTISIPAALFNEGEPAIDTRSGSLAVPCPPQEAGAPGDSASGMNTKE